MFAIGDKRWPGISKLAEEAGEVVQVVGKLMGSRGNITHWNVKNLKTALEEELADLLAAIYFVCKKNSLSETNIKARADMKLARYEKWHQNDAEQ